MIRRLAVLLVAASLGAGAAGTAAAQPTPSPEPSRSSGATPPPSPDARCPSPSPSPGEGPSPPPARAPCPEEPEVEAEGAAADAAPGAEEEAAPAVAPGAPAAGAASKGTAERPAAAPAADVSVSAEDNFFAPVRVTVTAGETVFWSNNGANPHTVTADDGSFDSGTLNPGDGFSLAPGTSGTIPYFCRFHGAPGGVGMSGVIVVQAAAAPAVGTPSEGPQLAATGFDPLPILVGGIALLALGAGLLLAARARGRGG